MPTNQELYESDEVVSKYTANSTRVRCLNETEKNFIDRFDIKNKNILVLGSGAGRVPANLLLFGNSVTGVELSSKLAAAAVQLYPPERFRDLHLIQGDATDLSVFPDESFDVVFFPQNGLDYSTPKSRRDSALREMAKKVKPGGLLAFSSHNKLAYLFSPKLRWSQYSFYKLFSPFYIAPEKVIGGGMIFKGHPHFVIKETVQLTGLKYIGFTCDTRSILDRLIARKLVLAQWYFPYLLYVFKK